MSQSFQQGLVSFSNGLILHQQQHLEQQHQQHQHHIQQQSRRDKLRVQGFEPPPSLVAIPEGEMPVYETGGMWSDMFNFPPGAASTSTDLLENQIPSNYRSQPPAPVEWYGNRHMGPLGDSKHHHQQQQPNTDNREDSLSHNHHQQISSINAADSAAAMQLFLMNPQHQSPPPPPSPTTQTQPPSSSSPLHLQGFPPGFHTHHQIPPHQYTQLNTSKIGGAIESRGLSLTLSSSAEELRMGEDGVLYYDQGGAGTSSYHVKGLGSHHQQMHLGQNQHIGLSRSSLGISSLLRNSKFLKATQELLEEFCSVGRGHMKNKLGRHNSNPNPNQSSSFGVGGSSTSKELPSLSAADRIDCQRKKTKLLSMLDEVDRRYNHYCEQMQMVVNSFDSLMGFGAATPYTALAQKAMSRHFRCLKDAITTQLNQICELLGDKDGVATSGVTKGETPRLRLLEQSLRQQRAFHQMGMMDQEAWRPQRGLPERSVNILRAWLFEHFLHPYPSDADKHLLARQTGLSRNQVSNWFINARVRLWKPMVEDMYQQEAKEEDTAGDGDDHGHEENETNQHSQTTQTPTSSPPASTTSPPRCQENDSSLNAMNKHHLYFSENQANKSNPTTTATAIVNPTTVMVSNAATTTTNTTNTPLGADISTVMLQSHVPHLPGDDTCLHGSSIVAQPDYRTTHSMASTVVRFGTTMGDVSLTLGLRHAGNLPEKSRFSVRDFGDC